MSNEVTHAPDDRVPDCAETEKLGRRTSLLPSSVTFNLVFVLVLIDVLFIYRADYSWETKPHAKREIAKTLTAVLLLDIDFFRS